jgi:hypothetical protein
MICRPTSARLESTKAALFQEMLRNPANLDATFAYAEANEPSPGSAAIAAWRAISSDMRALSPPSSGSL